MTREVIFNPAANADLTSLYRYLVKRSAEPTSAFRYVVQLRGRCARLALVPEQGSRLVHRGLDLRVIGFRRRVTIVFRVMPDQVEVLRLLYGGRDVRRALRGLP